jgi:hypothetical protein
MKKWLLIILAFTPIILIVLLFVKSSSNKVVDEKMPDGVLFKRKNEFQLANHLTGLNKQNPSSNFAYDAYLDSVDLTSYYKIKSDITLLDSITGNKDSVMVLMVNTLTTKLEKKIHPKDTNYSLDTVIQLLHWAERFTYYGEVDVEHGIIFSVTHDYWFNFITNYLSTIYQNNNDLKYNDKFKYLLARLGAKQYYANISFDKGEKVINNIVGSKWSYLVNRFWIGTTSSMKAIAFTFALITGLSYVLLAKWLLNGLKKKSKQK